MLFLYSLYIYPYIPCWIPSSVLVSFCMASSAFSIYYDVVCILWRFYSFPTDLNNFYFFFPPITVGRTSSSVLTSSGESGHPHLGPDFSQKAFSFSRLSLLHMVFVINSFSCVEICSLCTHCCKGFIVNGWILSSAFSASMERIMGSGWCSLSHWFTYVEPSLWPWDESKLVIVYDFFWQESRVYTGGHE